MRNLPLLPLPWTAGPVCNLPYLPVTLVEDAVARYYGGLSLGQDFLVETAELIEEVMREEQQRFATCMTATASNCGDLKSRKSGCWICNRREAAAR